ncbi:DUF2065 domain-containing protein [Grimontia hollisae]|uniref:Protein YjeT n=2 Tax=Grimontia hollisae TaxID=673 RepID=D0I8Q9_GRIHO|nr:DUF2065 domain-containing protein [Grimontia hollisae]AMG30871.1 DUF2065 domain-containing protein [Grimontia hollisae]EEY73028.1 protein YjeT [Grimontia hollisae CIP 101886]MDF2183193.1 DUF2065 domain-containing protein [Grimontia hollisae]STO47222.1 Uncharacterized protein conserved in bacteria (DUF2065) [Grimontia hollisae]STO56043.1 Uncharacterized protein conserved in bacteria (DUF2065) [Grimontia hollisae]
MGKSIWLAIGLVLVVEGLGPMLVPQKWREMISEMSLLPDATLRRIGGCLVVAGAVIAYMMWPSK